MNIRLGILSQKVSIRNQIIFLILIILILPLLFTFYYLDKPLEKAIRTKIGYSAQEALKLAGRNIEFATEEMFAAANEIAQSPRVIQLLQDPQALTPYEKYELQHSELNKVSRSNHTSYVCRAQRSDMPQWRSTSGSAADARHPPSCGKGTFKRNEPCSEASSDKPGSLMSMRKRATNIRRR